MDYRAKAAFELAMKPREPADLYAEASRLYQIHRIDLTQIFSFAQYYFVRTLSGLEEYERQAPPGKRVVVEVSLHQPGNEILGQVGSERKGVEVWNAWTTHMTQIIDNVNLREEGLSAPLPRPSMEVLDRTYREALPYVSAYIIGSGFLALEGQGGDTDALREVTQEHFQAAVKALP